MGSGVYSFPNDCPKACVRILRAYLHPREVACNLFKRGNNPFKEL